MVTFLTIGMANVLNISQQDSHHCVQSLCHRMDHHSCYRSRWIRWRVLFLILNKKYGIKMSKIYDCSNIKGKTMIQMSYPWIRAWFGSSYKPAMSLSNLGCIDYFYDAFASFLKLEIPSPHSLHVKEWLQHILQDFTIVTWGRIYDDWTITLTWPTEYVLHICVSVLDSPCQRGSHPVMLHKHLAELHFPLLQSHSVVH